MSEFDMIFNPESTEQGFEQPLEVDGVTEIKTEFVEIRDDMEGFEGTDVIVTGDPFAVAPYLDSAQGDNPYNCYGCCGLNSCSNMLVIAGIESSENEIVEYAIENDLCHYNDSWFGDPSSNGGTNDMQQEAILEAHGLEVTAYPSQLPGGSLNDIANAIESGHGVTVGINAGALWDEPSAYGDGSANHQITITGTQRDAETGELVGFVICDSGRGLESDACRSVSVETMTECYTYVNGSSAIISDNPIR